MNEPLLDLFLARRYLQAQSLQASDVGCQQGFSVDQLLVHIFRHFKPQQQPIQIPIESARSLHAKTWDTGSLAWQLSKMASNF